MTSVRWLATTIGLDAFLRFLRHPGVTWRACDPRTRTWISICCLAFSAVSVVLYGYPEEATNYWYLYQVPMTMATFVFGLRGAIGGSVASLLSFAGLYFFSLSARADINAALEPLQALSVGSLSNPDVYVLASQAITLVARDPRMILFQGMTGLFALIATNVALGVLVDRGRNMEQLAIDRAAQQLKRYFSPQLVQTILSGEQWVGLTTVRKEVTVLFTDLRGFTGLTEQIQPEELGQILNVYLSEMTEVIFKYDGTLDKYIGDSVMAFFGDPVSHGDDPERALRAAIEMRERFENLRTRWVSEGRDALHVGIGLNSGFVTAGNVGSATRMEYTVVGSAVNIASRLADLAAPGQILTTQRSLAALSHLVEWRTIGKVDLQGVPYPVDAVEVQGLRLIPLGMGQDVSAFDLVVARAADDPAFRSVLLTRPVDALRSYALIDEEQQLAKEVASLLGYPLFRGVPGPCIAQFIRAARREHVPAGTTLAESTGEGRFGVLAKGEVALQDPAASGGADHVASIGRGAHINTPDWLRGQTIPLTAYATIDAEVLSLDEADLRRLGAAAPRLLRNIEREARRRADVHRAEGASTEFELPAAQPTHERLPQYAAAMTSVSLPGPPVASSYPTDLPRQR